MRITGFCELTPDGLNVISFLVRNIAGMTSSINPNAIPRIVITDTTSLSRGWETIPLLYHPNELKFCPVGSQEIQKAKNIFLIDPPKVQNVFGKLAGPTDQILALWQALFHELRHFAQFNFLNKRDLVGRGALRKIAKLNPETGREASRRLRSYLALPRNEMDKEIDAVVTEFLCIHTLLATFDGKEFDFNKTKKALLWTKNDSLAEPCRFLEVFRVPLAV